MTNNTLWLYFRIVVGVVMLLIFGWLVITQSADDNLITTLLSLLIGLLTSGDSILALREARLKK